MKNGELSHDPTFIHDTGSDEEIPRLSIADDQILIRIRDAGVNESSSQRDPGIARLC